MNNKKILKQLILMFIFFIIGIIQMTNVKAASYSASVIAGKNIGDSTYVTKSILKSSSSLYCIQHHANWPSGTYTIKEIVEIEGNEAKLITSSGTSKTYESTVNGKLAYILAAESGGKYGYNSNRQKELWYYFNKWYNYSGKVLGLRNIAYSGNVAPIQKSLDEEATKYANSGASKAKIKVESVTTNVISENKLVGPIKLSKTGTISSIKVNDSDSIIGPNSTDFAVCDQNGNIITPDASGAFNSISDSATIYIKQLGDETVKKVKIVASAEGTYNVRMCILESNGSGEQRLIAVQHNKTKTWDDVTIDFVTDTTLEIDKVDSRTNANLQGATFVLQHKNRYASKVEYRDGIYYVKEWSEKYYKQDAEENEKAMQEMIDNGTAYQFVVGENGLKISIPRDDSTVYALTELKAPEGYEIGLGYVKGEQLTAYIMNREEDDKSSTYTDSYGIQTKNNKSTFYFDLKYKTSAKVVLSNSKKVSLTIYKVDKDNVQTKLNNVEFYFKHDNLYAMAEYTDTTGIWKVVGWTKYENQATKFITGDNIDDGRLVIEFAEDGTKKGNQYLYGLVEVKNPNNNYLINPIYMDGSTNITDTKTDNDKLSFRINTSGYNSQANMTIANITNTIITIKKVSATDINNNIKGAEFVLKHNYSYAYAEKNNDGVWEIVDWKSEMDYTIDSSEVTKFVTDENGEIKIEVPKDDEVYGLIEVKAAENYGINLGFLADKSVGVKPFDGTKSNQTWAKGIDSSGIRTGKDEDTKKSISEFYFYVTDDSKSEVKVWITNAGDTPISISGYAWVDVPSGKVNDRNNVYDSGETRLSNISVKLLDLDDNVVAETKTNSNGEYTFENACSYNNIHNYYIEFDYSNTNYAKYYPVLQSLSENGSRASQMEEHIEKGKAIITELDEYLDRFYDTKTSTLKYMNLGIRNVVDPETSVTETLEYVKIVMNNYTYFYEYGVNGEIKGTPPTVKYQNKDITSYYSRPFYPSDILKSMTDWTNGIEVYVAYSITIKNINNNSNQIHLDIESLKNDFDSSRYEIWNKSDGHETNNDIEVKMRGDYKNWDLSGNYINTTRHVDPNGKDCSHYIPSSKVKNVINGGTLSPGESVTKYIQFRVKDNAIEDILNNPNGIEEENPTTAIANGSYYRTTSFKHKVDGSWCSGTRHSHSGYSGNDSAPYLVFSLGTERKISGTVFYDTVKTSNLNDEKILGDGQYNPEGKDDDENKDYPVENVKVELMPGNTDYNYKSVTEENVPAMIYYESDDAKTKNGVSGIAVSDKNGNFTIQGVTPGIYYLKFTYPNGETKIMNSDDGTIVSVNDYKSTVIKSDIVREQILLSTNSLDNGKNVSKDMGWYRHIDTNYSVAVDNLSQRSLYNTQYWNWVYNNGSNPEVEYMYATTPVFEIKVENYDLNESKNRLNDNLAVNEWDYSGFNFGIIKQAKQLATIQKVISNVKLEQDPQVIFDGNPESGLSGVTDLDDKNSERTVYKYNSYKVKDVENNNGSTYLRVEIAEDSLYGSDLVLTYDLRVTNESEVNYYEIDDSYYGWYYMFGDIIENVTYPVEISTTVDDYLDSLLQFTGNTNNATRENDVIEVKSDDDQNTIAYKYGLIYNNQIERTSTETVVLQAHKLLSELEDEWNYNNGAKIRTLENKTSNGENKDKTSISLVVTPINSPASNAKIGDDYQSYTETIVTTPTGLDKSSIIIYIVTTIAGLIVLSVGIVFIKRKIIK